MKYDLIALDMDGTLLNDDKVIPKENVDDLEDVAKEVKEHLEIIPVHHIEEVLKTVGILKDSSEG